MDKELEIRPDCGDVGRFKIAGVRKITLGRRGGKKEEGKELVFYFIFYFFIPKNKQTRKRKTKRKRADHDFCKDSYSLWQHFMEDAFKLIKRENYKRDRLRFTFYKFYFLFAYVITTLT